LPPAVKPGEVSALSSPRGDAIVTGMVMISGPVIAKLALRTRKWAHEHMRRGTFGPVIVHDGVLYAALAAVEHALGETFSAAQIAAAGAPGRALAIAIEPQEEAMNGQAHDCR